ncbi:MAG: hypothetical protein WBA54_07645 [Acidaminobacteraceae bacterium]
MNKTNKRTFKIILLLEILQTCFIIYSTISYKGVHSVTSSIGLGFAFSYAWYRLLSENHINSYYKLRIFFMLILTIGVSITLFITQPEYTYEDGIVLIMNDFDEPESFSLTKYNFKMSTVPVNNDPERFLIYNRNYYYRFNIDKGYIYYNVDPVSGKVTKQSKRPWPDDVD